MVLSGWLENGGLEKGTRRAHKRIRGTGRRHRTARTAHAVPIVPRALNMPMRMTKSARMS